MSDSTPFTPVTRFAPSPTGLLHLGHAYAALVARDVARAGGGRALIRIEDLDRGRARAEFEAAIFEDLTWLGLDFDPDVVRQSERMALFEAATARLTAMGLTYPCFCTRSTTRAQAGLGGAPHEGEEGGLLGPVYPGTCRGLGADERAEKMAAGAPFALRLEIDGAFARAIADRGLEFFEAFAGGPRWIAADPRPAGDIVLARKDLGTSYHVAVVVDDAAQGITAVTRGEDLLAATHIHVLLQRLLGLPTPRYGHHTLMRDADGKRLAKRAHAQSIRKLRERGLSPAQVRAMLPPLPDIAALTNR